MTKVLTTKDEASSLCPECNGWIITDSRSGDKICTNCGLVVSEREIISSLDGERQFVEADERDKRERVGNPVHPLFSIDIHFSTVIGRKEAKNPEFKRVKKWNSRSIGKERELIKAHSEIKRISHKHAIPKHIQGSAILTYRKIRNSQNLRGIDSEGLVIASLLFAIRLHHAPITMDELLDDIEERRRKRIKRSVLRALFLALKYTGVHVAPTSAISFVRRYSSQLNMNGEMEKVASDLCSVYEKRVGMSGKKTIGVLAASIYVAGRLKNANFTQSEVAKVVGVTEVTLRTRCKELIKVANIPFVTLNAKKQKNIPLAS